MGDSCIRSLWPGADLLGADLSKHAGSASSADFWLRTESGVVGIVSPLFVFGISSSLG